MPFTFAHPAVVVPVNYLFRKKVSYTGIIAGSLVPDFEYFLRVFHESYYTHTWAGLFYADLPGGLLLCFLYHNLIRKPFYTNAPLFVRWKMALFQSFSWNLFFVRKWKVVLFSILFGAFTHLVWDKFTHHTVPVLQSVAGYEQPSEPIDYGVTYSVFWDINSLIGVFLVLYAFFLLPASKKINTNQNKAPYWLCFFGCAAALLFLQWPYIRSSVLDDVVIVLINALLLSVLFVSVVFTQPRKETKYN